MRIIVQIIAIILIGYLAELFLPWYSIAFVAFVFGYYMHSESNFLGGFIAVVILWGMKILLIMSVASTELASRVATIFPLKETWILIAVTLLIGGLIGGFATMTGALLRPKPKNADYYPRRASF